MSDRFEDGTEWLMQHDKELLQIVDLLDKMSVQIKSLQIRVEELERGKYYEGTETEEDYSKEGYGGTAD